MLLDAVFAARVDALLHAGLKRKARTGPGAADFGPSAAIGPHLDFGDLLPAVAGDANFDGFTDVVVSSAHPAVAPNIYIYLGSAAGTFSRISFAHGQWLPRALGKALLDANLDGKLDLAVFHEQHLGGSFTNCATGSKIPVRLWLNTGNAGQPRAALHRNGHRHLFQRRDELPRDGDAQGPADRGRF